MCIGRNPTKTICWGQNWKLLCVCVCVWPLDLVKVVPISKHVCIDLVVHYIPRLTIAWNGMLYPSIINLGRLGCKLHNIKGSNPLKGTSFYRCVLNVGHSFWVLNIFSCKVFHEEFILMLILGVQGPLVWWCSIKPLCQETCNNFVALGKKNSDNNLKVLQEATCVSLNNFQCQVNVPLSYCKKKN